MEIPLGIYLVAVLGGGSVCGQLLASKLKVLCVLVKENVEVAKRGEEIDGLTIMRGRWRWFKV